MEKMENVRSIGSFLTVCRGTPADRGSCWRCSWGLWFL